MASVRIAMHTPQSAFAQRRRASQPLEYPSAGSVFKRPEGHFAGQLIERCGLKGYRIGDAQVSEKHAGFIVNRGEATCAQVLELMEHIQKTVLDQTGVRLEPEIRVLKCVPPGARPPGRSGPGAAQCVFWRGIWLPAGDFSCWCWAACVFSFPG